MTAQAKPYVRVYYSITNDPKFAGIGDRALGCWLRLLIVADAMYPEPAFLPRKVRETDLKLLVDAGLVDLLPEDRFLIHGLSQEREGRSEHARGAARARWEQSTSNATSAPLRTEPIRSTPEDVKPWVTLTPEERLERERLDKDEAIRRTMLQVGLKPELVKQRT